MKLILTDRPSETVHLLPPAWRDRAWQPQHQLSQQDQDLWHALGGGATPWGISLVDGSAPSQFFSRLVLIADAARSQYDLLRDQLGECVRRLGPVACVALEGRGFHGQRGRSWSAVRGNLHLSLAIAPGVTATPYALSMTMLPAVAVIDALVATAGPLPTVGIKWVNDILIEGRKVAGVLAGTQLMGDRLDLVAMGIGLNVAVTPDVVSTPFVPQVGCLRELAGLEPTALGQVLWALLDAIALRIRALLADGPEGLFAAYRERSLVVGRQVRIWEEGVTDGRLPSEWPPPSARGLVLDLGSDLSLKITGSADRVDRGRLAFEEACREAGL